MAVSLSIQVKKGDQLVAEKSFDRDIIKIGRLASAHMVIDDDKVSRIHAVIEASALGSLSVIDMGSVEGTFVNGKRVNKSPLKMGDQIQLGSTTLVLAEPGQAVATPSMAPATSAPAIGEGNDAPTAVMPQVNVASEAISAAPTAQVQTPNVQPVAPPPPPAEALAPAALSAAPSQAPVVRNEQTGTPVRAHPGRTSQGVGVMGLTVRLSWGDQRVGEFFLRPDAKKASSFTVGSQEGVDFEMGDKLLGESKFTLVSISEGHFNVRFNAQMSGEFHRGDKVFSLKEAMKERVAHSEGMGGAVELHENDYVWIDLGGVVAEVFMSAEPKRVFVPFAESIDYRMLNLLLLMFFIASVFVIQAINDSLAGDEFADDLSDEQARIAKLIVKPPEKQKNQLLQRFEKKKDAGQMAAKRKGKEGKMGKKNAPKRSARTAPKGDPSKKDQARMLAQNLFSGRGGLSTVMGNAMGGELQASLGNMFGARAGNAHGLGGLGMRGSGSGGGGQGNTIGIGGLGTKGRGGGVGGYGSGVGLGKKGGVGPRITMSEPLVMGSLDKELIRKVIRSHLGQIRSCYERQLQRNPKLAGKVKIKFVIMASGKVASSKPVESTVGNKALEQCVASRARTWVFPKPKGGGIVVVNYPFLFNQAGR